MIKNFFYRIVLFFFRTIIPILFIPIVYRKIPIEKMGEINYILSIGLIFYMFSDLGVYNLGLRVVCENRNNKEILKEKINEVMRIKNMIVLVSLILYFVIVYVKYKNILFYLNGIIIFSLFFHVEWILEGLESYKFITIKTLIIRILTIIFILLFLDNKNGYLIYFVITLLSYILNTVSSYFYLRYRGILIELFKIGNSKKSDFKLKNLCFIALMTNSNILLFNLDKLILGYKNLNDYVAAYSLSEKILTLCTSMTILLIIQVILPKLITNYRSDKKKYWRQVLKLYDVLIYIGFPMYIGLLSLNREIFIIFGGHSYDSYVNIFKTFLIYIPIYIIFEYFKIVICLILKLEKLFVRLFIVISIPILLFKILFLTEKNILIFILLTNINLLLIPVVFLLKKRKIKTILKKTLKIMIISVPILTNKYINLSQIIYINIFIKVVYSVIIYSILFYFFNKKEARRLYELIKVRRSE